MVNSAVAIIINKYNNIILDLILRMELYNIIINIDYDYRRIATPRTYRVIYRNMFEKINEMSNVELSLKSAHSYTRVYSNIFILVDILPVRYA